MRVALVLALLVPSCGASTSRSSTRRALDVFTDGEGQYVAVSFANRQLYFGRDTKFWAVRTYPGTGGRLGFHDPRLVMPGVLRQTPEGVSVSCLDKEMRLTEVREDDANAVMDDAVFEQQQPTSTPVALGAAADGTYAYIDVEGDERRVFVGAPGKVRRVEVTSAEGGPTKFHLETAAGKFDVSVGESTVIVWNGTPLAALDPMAQWRLIFEQLHVYPARSPTPCDLVM
jgi:hypothetical protein